MLRTMRLPLRVEDNLSLRATRHRRNPAKIDAVPRRRGVVRLLAWGGGSMSTRLWWIGPMIAAALGTALCAAAAGVQDQSPIAITASHRATGWRHRLYHRGGADRHSRRRHRRDAGPHLLPRLFDRPRAR